MRAVVVGLVAVLALSACTSDGGGDDAATAVEVEAPSSAPSVAIPDGAPPDELVVERLEEGTGEVATEGDTVRVNFVAAAWSSGEVVDSTWDRAPFQFTIGGEGEIRGFDGHGIDDHDRLAKS